MTQIVKYYLFTVILYAISMGYAVLVVVGAYLFVNIWWAAFNPDKLLRIILIAIPLFVFYVFIARRLLKKLIRFLQGKDVTYSSSFFKRVFYSVYGIHIVIAIIAILE
jgi:hypothetical protein